MINETAMLYVAATPIGNLKDISQRASRVLAEADFIVCERPSHSLKLLSFLGIRHKALVAFTEANKKISVPRIVSLLKSGKTGVFIVDAGTPGISDPGPELIKSVRENGIEIVSLPGPSALAAAISLTGERMDKFLFIGFFSRKQKEFSRCLEIAKANKLWLIGFESPFRLTKTLAQIPEDFFVILVSEISKLHEKVISGVPSEILGVLRQDQKLAKGEFVVFVKPTNNK